MKNTAKSLGYGFRVYKIDSEDRQAIKEARLATQQTVAQFVERAITDELPKIVTEMKALGVLASDQTGPVRLPLLDRDIAELQHAAKALGVDQSFLLVLALRRTASFHGVVRATKVKAAKPAKKVAEKKVVKAKVKAAPVRKTRKTSSKKGGA